MKCPLPVKFKVLAGKLGFSIVIEGTPMVNNEAYYCDLELLLTTCNCMDPVIRNKTEQTCNVTISDGVQLLTNDHSIIAYPNPASQTLTVDTPSGFAGKPYAIVDNSGKPVITGIVANGATTVDTSNLPAGNYYIQIQEIKKALSIIK